MRVFLILSIGSLLSYFLGYPEGGSLLVFVLVIIKGIRGGLRETFNIDRLTNRMSRDNYLELAGFLVEMVCFYEFFKKGMITNIVEVSILIFVMAISYIFLIRGSEEVIFKTKNEQ